MNMEIGSLYITHQQVWCDHAHEVEQISRPDYESLPIIKLKKEFHGDAFKRLPKGSVVMLLGYANMLTSTHGDHCMTPAFLLPYFRLLYDENVIYVPEIEYTADRTLLIPLEPQT